MDAVSAFTVSDRVGRLPETLSHGARRLASWRLSLGIYADAQPFGYLPFLRSIQCQGWDSGDDEYGMLRSSGIVRGRAGGEFRLYCTIS